jgi:hypothetical protein
MLIQDSRRMIQVVQFTGDYLYPSAASNAGLKVSGGDNYIPVRAPGAWLDYTLPFN